MTNSSSGAFSRAHFEALLDTIQRDLADLSYIDHVLDARKAFYDLSYTDPDGSLTYVSEQVAGFDIQVGDRYPFEISVYGVIGTAGDQWRARLSDYRQRATSWAQGEVDAVRHAVPTIVDPDSPLLAIVIEELEKPALDLTMHIPGVLDQIESQLKDWHGQAKSSFDDFLVAGRQAIIHQAWLSASLRVAVAQAKAVIDLGQVSLLDSMDKLRQDIDQQLQARVDANEGASRTITFLLLAATGVGVAAALPLPVLGQATLAASSTLLSYAKDSVPEPDKVDTDHRRAGEYAESMAAAVNHITRATVTHWDRVQTDSLNELYKITNEISGLYKQHAFVPPTPSIVEGPVAPGEFTHTTHTSA